jgi:hypothetical protein
MRNPWLDLPEQAPYVLGDDRAYVDEFNGWARRNRKPSHALHLELFPEPWIGAAMSAPVVLLSRNPGFVVGDRPWHRKPGVAALLRANLRQAPSEYPFVHLHPSVKRSPGGRWWRRCLNQVLGHRSVEQTSRGIVAIEFHGYHSTNWTPVPVTLPSQWYGFALVTRAIHRGAIIIAMRGWRDWTIAVPGLREYEYCYQLQTARSSSISPRNCPKGFGPVLDVLG